MNQGEIDKVAVLMMMMMTMMKEGFVIVQRDSTRGSENEYMKERERATRLSHHDRTMW